MADLRKETHGAGSMKAVNLVVISYDNRVAKKDGEVTTHYLDARIHPGDARGPGQVSLALVSKEDKKSPSGFNNSARYSASQFAAIKETAGNNVSDLTNANGEVLGKIYGVKADLLISNGDVIANTKTLTPSELSVGDDAKGSDIRSQIFESMKTAKEARAAAKDATAVEAAPAAEAPVAEAAEAAVVEAPAAAPKAKAVRKPATRKPAATKVLASVGAGDTQVASDEPELG